MTLMISPVPVSRIWMVMSLIPGVYRMGGATDCGKEENGCE
jgi:hypothetical protein